MIFSYIFVLFTTVIHSTYLLHGISLCSLLRGLQHRTCTTFADLKMWFWSIKTVGAMNPASRRIHRSVLGPYPKSQSRSTNQVRDRGTRARPARPPRGRGLKLGRPLDRARARSRVRVPAGFFLELWLGPAFRSGHKKLLNAWSASSCPKSMAGSV